jgi:hypothetical protein
MNMQFSTREINLQNNTDVPAWVAARAEEIRKECEAEGYTFYMLPAIPAEGEYANVYEYERSMAFSAYSDTHKDVYGYRPRGDFSEWTLETIEEETHKIVENSEMDKTFTQEQWEGVADTLDENWSKWEKMAFDEGHEI